MNFDMKQTTKLIRLFFSVSLFLILFTCGNVSAKQFTVVIDAGHGGHDSGAQGKFSKEKNLNLSVSMRLGKMIEDNYPEIKVVYTRKKDVFLTLQERADIVNKNNADVFLCIHTNANNSSAARGTETYTLRASGSRTQGNLEVAMRENSVMLLEDDYKTRYQGFDPRSVDSYIMFDFMQDKYLDKSVQLASSIQQQFVRTGRYDRGVQQAGFWVLYKSACPSVLVEMGFISNPSEEKYLNSDEGQRDITNAIYRAFLVYKKDHDKKSGKTSKIREDDLNQPEQINNVPLKDTVKDTVKETGDMKSEKNAKTQDAKTESITIKTDEGKNIGSTTTSKSKIVYKLQILASKSKTSKGDPDLKGLTDVQEYRENGLYKYTYGEFENFAEANKLRKKLANKFPQAFVVKFKDGKKVDD